MLNAKEIFAGFTDEPMWLIGKAGSFDTQIMLTLTGARGSKSAHISGGQIQYIDTNNLLEAPEQVAEIATVDRFKTLRKLFHYSGYVMAVTLLIFSAFSFSGDVKARIVLTGSMAPAINVGDVIITAPITRKAPQIDDVIAYQAKRFNGENVAVFSHRIIDGDIENGFIVKGDANKSPDPQKPTGEDILGVVFFVIPFIGNLLTPKALFLLLPCAFGLWLIMDAMKNVE
jgi:signal peptidase